MRDDMTFETTAVNVSGDVLACDNFAGIGSRNVNFVSEVP